MGFSVLWLMFMGLFPLGLSQNKYLQTSVENRNKIILIKDK